MLQLAHNKGKLSASLYILSLILSYSLLQVLAQYLQWKYNEFLLGRPICVLDDDLKDINGPGNTKKPSSIQAKIQ